MRTLYDVDGKFFENKEDAKNYEKEIEAQKAEAERLAQEKQKRIDEIDELYNRIDNLYVEAESLEDKFYNDYGTYYYDNNCDDENEFQKTWKDKNGNTVKVTAKSDVPFDFEDFFNKILKF